MQQQQKQQQLQEGTPNKSSAIICQGIRQAYSHVVDFFPQIINLIKSREYKQIVLMFFCDIEGQTGILKNPEIS